MAGINIQNLCIYGESPDYRFFGSFQNASQGMDKVKEFYYSLWNSSSRLVELAIHRCLPGDWGLACDGEWYQQVPSTVMIDEGKQGVSPDLWYLSHAHLAWFFPYAEIDNEMYRGEICYIDEVGSSLTELDTCDVLSLEDARVSWEMIE